MIIATVQSERHAKRVSEKLTAKVNLLRVPNITCFSPNAGGDSWVTVHVGPMVVHLLTAEARATYNLEGVLTEPHNWLTSADFPHYRDFWQNSTPPDYVLRRGKPSSPVYDNSASEKFRKTDY